MKALANLFILFGILWCLMGGYYIWLRYNPNNLQFKNYNTLQPQQIKPTSKQKTFSQPTRLVIKDLQINLPLIPAKIENDVWETTDKGASYLVSSPIPGQEGNSIIYGHNWVNLLGNLTRAIPGQVVEITYADGSREHFVIEYTSTVLPTEASILDTSIDKRITLYTCTGFLDSKRFVAVAILEDKDLAAAY